MNEIYWLTRVGVIGDMGGAMATVSGLCLVLFPAIYNIMDCEDERWLNPKVVLKWLIGMLITGLLILAFLPSKKDLYLIYGLGSVIDYVEGNDKVKDIPDKAVDAIIEWMDLNKEGK